MNGHCITARLEVMQNVLRLANDYKAECRGITNEEAMDQAYQDFREEMQQQTILMKTNLLISKTL